MQTQTDPGESGTESQPTNLSGEIERLRFAIADAKGTTYWYQTPANTLAALNTSFTQIATEQVNVRNLKHVEKNMILALQVFS